VRKIAPSILSADFSRIAEQISLVDSAGADYIHVDVMDGHFVPAITWGPKIVGDLRRLTSMPFDCHLMIAEPELHVDAFCDAGADIVTFHLEATPHAQGLLAHIRSRGKRAGIAICPQTPVAMLDDLIEDCNLVLVMSVNPGRAGQAFIPRAMEKIREARALIDRRHPACELEVDGGVGESNLSDIVEAGANVLVMGSAIYDSADPGATLRRMRKLL
jgi:ribulose-phosphate 3-epimerase